MLSSKAMRPVVVVGPHRSGTSVTTRVVSLLGPALCAEDDLMSKWDNPAGHWESESLMTLNDELLDLLGGVWYAPPELPRSWEQRADLAPFRARAVREFYRVHPASNWVWKDPRLCLLLPFWTFVLEVDPVIVITVRHPVEIARSLAARDRWGPAHALAIWEWYVAAMLESCAGRPVAVVRYDELLKDAYREVSRLRCALESLGAGVEGGDVAKAVLAVEKKFRHQEHSSRSRLNAPQEVLHQILLDLDHAYDAFPEWEVPRLADSTVELIAAQRRIHRLYEEVEAKNVWAFKLEEEITDRETAIRELQAQFENWTTEAVRLEKDRRETLETTICANRDELQALRQSDRFRRRFMVEVLIARQHRESEEFTLPGFCLLDDCPVYFKVDWLYSHPPIQVDWLSSETGAEDISIPNWRERMICPKCGMNNRQRAIVAAVLDAIRRQRAGLGRPPRLYLTEQVTPMYRFLDSRVPEIACVGSEYLGPHLESGAVRDGLRHEDVLALSFDDASMDLVISCSVLEHVNEPLDAIAEMARILRPGGELFLEVPFDTSKERNTRRARIVGDEIEHLLPPVYHGDSMSSEGTLVFFDFGWELVEQIADTGLLTCEMMVYWSLELGHLGGIQFFFHARRTEAP